MLFLKFSQALVVLIFQILDYERCDGCIDFAMMTDECFFIFFFYFNVCILCTYFIKEKILRYSTSRVVSGNTLDLVDAYKTQIKKFNFDTRFFISLFKYQKFKKKTIVWSHNSFLWEIDIFTTSNIQTYKITIKQFIYP